MVKKLYLLSFLRDWWNLRTFRQAARRDGSALMTAAQKVIQNYVKQEKQNGFRLTDTIKTGIYAYYFNYADQAINRLEKLPQEQKVLGNELGNISVSDDFIQEMAPNLTEWEKLHYFQYGTIVHDMAGEPVDMVKASIGSVYLTSWMGLTHQKFKEQFKTIDRILSTPAFIEPIGPVIAYRKNMVSHLEYYFFSPNGLNPLERE